MDIREFRYLVAIAENGTIAKAANQLFITPSALSKYVQNKEQEFGLPLFDRVGKQFIPTYAGEVCIKIAKQVVALNQGMDLEIEKIVKGESGRIRLAFHSSWSDFFFGVIYPQFRIKHPNIDLKLSEIAGKEALKKVDNGEVDLGIVLTPWLSHVRYECSNLQTQQMVIAVNKNDEIRKNAKVKEGYPYPYIDIQYLKNQPIIMRNLWQQTFRLVMDLFHRNEMEPQIILETSSRENALKAVENGVGVTFTLDDPAWLHSHSDIRYLSYDTSNDSKVYVNAIYNKGVELSESGQDLLNIIQNYYKRN